MKIAKIELENFRSHKHVSIDNLGSTTVMVGPTGSGKTSLIEALDLFFKHFDGQPEKRLDNFNDRNWYLREVQNPITFRLTIEFSDEDIQSLSELIIADLKLEKNNSIELIAQINYSADKPVFQIAQNIAENTIKSPIPKQVDENKKTEDKNGVDDNSQGAEEEEKIPAPSSEYSPFYNLISSNFYWIKGSRLVDSEPDAIEVGRTPYVPLEIQHLLTELNNSDKAEDTRKLSQIRTAFHAILSDDSSLTFDKNGVQVFEGEHKYPLNLLGAGEQAYLYLLFEIIKNHGKIIAIEDPGLHLFPKMEIALFKFLRGFSNQIFIITHSPSFLDLNQLNNNLIFGKEDYKSTIIKASKKEDLNDLVNVLGRSDPIYPNKIIFVGGETETYVVPIWLSKLGADPLSPALRIEKFDGDYDWRILQGWIEATRGTDTDIFMILEKGAETIAKKAENEGIREENIHILRDSIEDYYPKGHVEKSLREEFEFNWKTPDKKTIKKIDDNKSKLEEIRRIILEGYRTKNDFWKVPLGKSVAGKMSADQIPGNLRIFLKTAGNIQ